MIHIRFTENEEEKTLGFEASGHAMTAPRGEDLVCAAASALAGTLEGYAELLIRAEETLPVPPEIESEAGRQKIRLTLSPEGYLLGRIAFHVIRTGFLRLAAAYPASVTVTM